MLSERQPGVCVRGKTERINLEPIFRKRTDHTRRGEKKAMEWSAGWRNQCKIRKIKERYKRDERTRTDNTFDTG